MLEIDLLSDEDFVSPSRPSIQRGHSMSESNYPTTSPKTPTKSNAVRFASYEAFKASNRLAALGDGFEYKTNNHWGSKHSETTPDGETISVFGNYKYVCNTHFNCKAWVSNLCRLTHVCEQYHYRYGSPGTIS